ncbi:MAG: DUF885 domain-containing protein [Hyphomonadaceae bacterium]
MIITRRRAAAVLGSTMLTPILASCATASGASGADVGFEALGARWLETSLAQTPIEATKIGEHRFDAEVDDLSAAGRAAQLRFAQETLAALAQFDRATLSRANQVDAALLENQLRGQIWALERQQAWAWNPLFYQAKAGDAIYALMSREFAPLSVRLDSVTARLEKLPALLRQSREELVLARVPPPHAETYSRQNPGLKSLIAELVAPNLDQLSPASRARAEAAIAAFETAVDEQQRWIESEMIPAARGEWRAGAQMFDEQLPFTLATNLSRQEIRRRADAAVVEVRAAMYSAAKRALAGRSDAPVTPDNPNADQQQAAIRAALDISGAERPTRDNIVQVATAAVDEAAAFIRARDLITLPAAPVRVIEMPEFQQGVAVAYCDSPGPLERQLETFYAVSPIPASWTDAQAESFLREYNNRAIIDVGVHEAMPGHFVQLAHANAYPSVLRAVLASGPFIEGWACYAEIMMVDEGFRADDPLYELAQLKVQLRTITNAILDQAVHVDGISEEEAMHLLTHTAFQEEREAAGKWRRAQLSITQLSTYFVGLSEHQETRAAAAARPGFQLKAYHDGILSFGSPPVRYARALLFGEPIQ